MTAKQWTSKAERTGEALVVTLAGELDMNATFGLELELERLTQDTDARALVVDMDGVEFMDSSALGLLLATQERLRAHGIRFLLANPSRAVRRMLELTGAGDALSVTPWPSGR
jgi:anti-anti-sigma factor